MKPQSPFIALWPPLQAVAAALSDSIHLGYPEREEDRHEVGASLVIPTAAKVTLEDLARRRSVRLNAERPRVLQPGMIVLIAGTDLSLPVMLNFKTAVGSWIGWVVGAEPDWASSFDVLLEPDDAFVDPMCAAVQTWNSVVVHVAPESSWLGSVDATRLASIRAVADEYANGALFGAEPIRPGHVGLRGTLGNLTVLTGTRLGGDEDPRGAYQDVYRRAAGRLIASPQRDILAAKNGRSVGRGFADWFANLLTPSGGFLRPAFFALALAVAAQNFWLWRNAEDDDIRFRSSPSGAAAPAANVSVRWRPGATAGSVLSLLTHANASVVEGPDAEGAYRLRATDPGRAIAVLSAAKDVAEVHSLSVAPIQ